jgi:hypothetical protein
MVKLSIHYLILVNFRLNVFIKKRNLKWESTLILIRTMA